MKKFAKLFSVVAVAAAACTFFSLNSSNEIICGNIEALTGGDNGGGSSTPVRWAYLPGAIDADNEGGYYDPDFEGEGESTNTAGKCAWTYQLAYPIGNCVTIVLTKEQYFTY